MSVPNVAVKTTAKEALRDCFLQSVVVCCTLVFTVLIVELIGSVVYVFAGQAGYLITTTVLSFFAIFPMFLGVLSYFRRLIWGQKDSVLIIFRYFSNAKQYRRTLRFLLLLAIRFAFAAAVLYFPCALVWLLSSEQLYMWLDISFPVWMSNLWVLNSFLMFISTLIFAFVMLKYYLAPFIFASNDDIDPDEAINMSTIISKRTGADFFGLILSFAGWILISVLVSPLIFTLPYFITSYCVHSRFSITTYNLDVDRFNTNFAPSFSTDEI